MPGGARGRCVFVASRWGSPMAVVVNAAAIVREPFDPGFLGKQTIDAYLACLSSGPVRNDPRFAVFGQAPDWSEGSGRYPLPLCEFLIYKAILSYEKELSEDDR